MVDDRSDELAGQRRGRRVAFGGEVALEDRVRRALAELGLEHRGEGQPAAGRRLRTGSACRAAAASAPDAIDQDGDGAELQAEQALHGAATAARTWRGQRDERAGRAGRRAQTSTCDAVVADADRDRRAAEDVAPGRPAAADAQHARDLERGQPDRLADHARADRQVAASRARLRSTARRRPRTGAASSRRRRASASAIRSGTRVRAVVAPTRTACSIIRRRARPWVMITAPRTPRSGDPPTPS